MVEVKGRTVAVPDPIEELAAELRALLTRRAVDLVDPGELPLLHACAVATRSDDGDIAGVRSASSKPRVMNLQGILDPAIATIADQETRSALELLLGESDLRYRSVKERGTKAAQVFGVSYDAYRRAGSGRMHSDLLVLAGQIAEQNEACAHLFVSPAVSQDPTGVDADALMETEIPVAQSPVAQKPTPPPSPAARPSRGLLLVAAIALLAVVAGAWMLRSGESEDDQATPVSELPAWSEPICRPAGYLGSNTDSDADPDMTAAAEAIAGLSSELPEGSCVDEPVTHRGPAYWQQVSFQRRLAGGMIAFRSPENGEEMSAVFLPLGLWQSYFRVAGGDGSRSPKMAGFPTGEVALMPDKGSGERFQMGVLGDVTLIAEEAEGSFYWMPLVAHLVWLQTEASDSPIGWPTSSVYISDGSFRVDFTSGYLKQNMDGVIEAFSVSDIGAGLPEGEVGAGLPEPEDMVGRIIRSIDGTGWFVDNDLKRWWIPDVQTWHCVGGDANVIRGELPGYEIHVLDYGGVARCPMSGGGFAPRGGGMDLGLYCHDWAGSETLVTLTDDGWVCRGENEAKPIDQTAACGWQYGPAAVAKIDEGDPRNWQCEQGTS